MPPHQRVLLATLAISLWGLSAFSSDLASLKTMYDRYVTDLQEAHREKTRKWSQDYVQALKTLETQVQASGELDALLAIRSEITRFKQTPTIPTHAIVRTPTALRTLQERYARQPDSYRREAAKAMFAMAKEYERRLDKLQRQLTAQGRIEDALGVKSERARVQQSPEVTAAEFTLAVQDTHDVEVAPRPDGEQDRDAKPPDPNAETSAPYDDIPFDSGTVRGVVITPPGTKAPSQQPFGRPMKRQPLFRTEFGPLRSGIRSQAFSQRRRDRQEHWHLRLKLRTPPAFGALYRPMVVVQFYAKKTYDQSDGTPQLLRTKRIRLKALVTNDPVTLDYPTFTVDPDWHRTWSGQRREGGHEILGAVISIFDYEQKLIHQEVSDRALLYVASPTMPGMTQEERYAALQKQLQQAIERRLRAAREADREPDEARLKQLVTRVENEIEQLKRKISSMEDRRQREGW